MPMNHRYLVVDESIYTGHVKLIVYKKSRILDKKKILEQVTFFNVNTNGLYVFRDENGNWGYGCVLDPNKEISFIPFPPNVKYASLSLDGKKILWQTEEGNKSGLIIRNIKENNERVWFSRLGHIRDPSWSPDSKSIAYYFVEPELHLQDAFMLNLVSGEDVSKEPITRQLAPASHQTALTANRPSPPLWSPDGTRLLFKANYENSELIRSYAYIVDINDTQLARVEDGSWNYDGNSLLLVRRVDISSKRFVFSRFNFHPPSLIDIDFPIKLPPNIDNGQWHPEGDLFAYITGNNELAFVDFIAKNEFKIKGFDTSVQLYWLNQD